MAENKIKLTTKLETFQDKVLVFKRQTLFVVNYSADIGDYLDATYPFMGIRHRGHSFATAHGLVFMNDLGVHLYNGETIVTLTGKMQDLAIPAFTSTAGANDVPAPQVDFDPEPEPGSPPPEGGGGYSPPPEPDPSNPDGTGGGGYGPGGGGLA